MVNEIRQLEKDDHRVFTAAIYRPGDGIPASCRDLEERTLYWYDIDKSKLPGIIASNVRVFLRAPVCYLGMIRRGYPMDGSRVNFLKAVALVDYFSGVDHMHTHFAWSHIRMLRLIRALAGIPYSLTVHAADIFSPSSDIEHDLKDASFVVAISEYNRRYLVDNFRLNPEKVHVIHCGIDPRWFAPKPGKANETPLILSVGRLVEKKGFDTLLHALALVKAEAIPFRAKIIGAGPLYDKLVGLCRRLTLQDRIEFIGALDPEKVKNEINRCDLFILACRRAANGDMDGIPLVLMEAMAAAKPVISTDISGIPELVSGACGILVEENDPVEIATAIKNLLQDEDMRDDMGRHAREKVLCQFRIDCQVAKLSALLHKQKDSRGKQ